RRRILRRFPGHFYRGCVAHCYVLPCATETEIPTRSAKLQPLELAAVAPPLDVFEVGQRAGGMTDIELGRRTGLASFIVVITGRAVRRADHPAGAGQQQFDPAILGL